ncbi:MAG TPA: GNAT family protein [Myxococcota bacterium]|nr:GNAT family protein [Myxococcota bacterium]
MILRADERTSLRSLAAEDAGPLFALVDANRAYLRAWLPWLDAVREVAQIGIFIRAVAEREHAGTSLELAVVHEGELAGVCGFRRIDHDNRSGELGYWLRADRQGRGIMSACCRACVRHGFESLGLNRIELVAASENARSRALAEALGFRLEGVLRQAGWLYDHYVDHAVYARLRSEGPLAQ